MKKSFSVIAFAFALFAFGNMYAQNTIYVGQSMPNGLTIETNTFFEFSGKHHVSSFSATEQNTEEGLFTRLAVQGNSKTDLFGHPEMPANRKLIRVPLGANAIVTIHNAIYEDIDLKKEGFPAVVYPAQPPRIKSDDYHEFVIDKAAYQQAGFEKHELVSVDMLGILRDKRIARINFIPFQYDPVRHILRVYHQIDFTVEFKNADIPATLALEENFASPCFQSVNNFLVNDIPESNRENFKVYPIKYVIIADRMFESQLQPFIEWKTHKGFIVVESYTDESAVGNTLSSIKSYIQGLYDSGTPDDPAPSYVLFVGDIQQIPTWSNGNGATDRNYCEYTGDLFPEIYYGRFSAQNTGQLQPYIDKTLLYEKYQMPDPAYLDEVVLIAGMDGSHGYDWGNGQINYGTINYFNPEHGITAHAYLYPQSGSNAAQIRQNISDGVTFGNYTAHCSPSGWGNPSFTISHIPALQNQDKYGVLIGNCCSSSEYQLNECFAEAIVRAQNKGAVGYIGASNSTYWDEDYYFAVGVGQISQIPPAYSETGLGLYDRAFHDHGEDFGEWYVSGDEMIFAGNLAVTEGSPGSAQYYWDVYNYMGDPSLMVFFSNPPVTAVTYSPLLPLQSTSFTVTTEPYAYVALSMNGDYIGAALASADGIAVLEFPALTQNGEGDVVVTRQNGQPFFGTVIIASPSGPYLMLEEVSISDANGNNNGQADFGESVALDVSLTNVGNGDANNTISTLIGSDPYVIVTKNIHQWPVIPGQTTLTEDSTFSLDIAADVPDQHMVNFDIELVTSSKETWTYEYDMMINAPVLTIESMIIDDSQTGNDNGRLDPGETATLKIINRNTGHCEAYDAVAQLNSICQYLSFENNTDSIGTLGLLGYKYAEFVVEVDADAPIGVATALFNYSINSGEYNAAKEFSEKIGLLLEDFETGDFTKFDWEMAGDQPWQTTNIYPYEGDYSAISGNITDGQSSILFINVDVMIADSISFVFKVSSQVNQDKLKFYVNNTMNGEWSGVGGGWNEVSVYLPIGIHTLKWVYEKDAGGFSGDDCAWLDYIIFPPLMTLTCYAGLDDYTCDGSSFQCQGQATDWISVEWTTTGDGNFDNAGILEPVYTPGSDDIANGSVILTLTAEDTEGSLVDDEMTLMVIETPETPVTPEGPDYVNLYIVTSSEYTTEPVPYTDYYEWRVEPIEAGSFAGIGIIGTITWNQSFLGTATISVRAMNNCGDGLFSDGFEVTVDNVVAIPEASLENTFSVYPNPSKGNFNLISSSGIRDASIIVYNIIGEKVFDLSTDIATGESIHIGLEHFPKGLYILSIRTDNSGFTEKLIIK
ncbi:MAG: T9SS type A sorting domain-containing protein [Bacteroidales bacterium]|nr:T9SS type A sorting domain-containing protein [Bacteroidales bacterium]